jgi:uncharacterized protein (TIGR02421 family)
VIGESSCLVAAADEAQQSAVSELVSLVVQSLAEQFNAFLLLEIWTGPTRDAAVGRPVFRVHAPPGEVPRTTLAALIRGIRRIELDWRRPAVELRRGGHAPRGLPSLLTAEQAQRRGCLMLGLEIPPVYRDSISGALYPRMLEQLHRGLSDALRQTFFAFARTQTRATVEHYQALGRRAVRKAVWEVDQQLAQINDEFDFLLAVTPVNVSEAFDAFIASRCQREPVFHYRLLSIDPDLLKRRLYEITLEKVEDPALGELFRQKRTELDRKITMLEDCETRRFYHGSMQLYGGVDDALLQLAEQMLARLPPRAAVRHGPPIDAAGFAERARAEIKSYRSMDAAVQVRGDVPGLLVSDRTLLIGQDVQFDADRVEALIAHEVGTHLLTQVNGRAQRLQLLRCGLPGCEELQEGIAVLSEWLVGGLNRARLRRLAARVVAVRRLIDGASFVEMFRELHARHGFSDSAAFTIAMRVFRGGGLTKDAIYLRGLVQLLDHLRGGGSLDELLIGKVSLESLPVVRELRWRQVLRPPMLQPRYLDRGDTNVKLKRLREGVNVIDLLDGDSL